MHKKTKRVALFLVLSLSLSLSPLKAFAVDKQNEINELEKQKQNSIKSQESIENDKKETSLKVAGKMDELTASNVKVQSFQTKIDELQGQIDELQGNLDKAQSDIDSKQKLIEKEEQESKERQDMLGNRLRSYYKNDMSSQTLNAILKSESITDLISNIVNISKLLDLDQNLLKKIEETKESLDKEKVSLQTQVDKLSEEKAQIKIKQQEQVSAQKEFVDEKNKYETQMKELKALEKEQQKKYDDLNVYKVDLQKQIDALFIDINKGGSTDPDISKGESFLTPAGGYISSYYGPRVNPVTKVNGFHTGVDFAASNQSNILASKSGTVVFAGVQSGYGNIVIIDHGGGIQTFYAHCSSFKVATGDAVNRGDVIAYVGSTGNSTGPHLHFEVRVNGVHKDPMNYL